MFNWKTIETVDYQYRLWSWQHHHSDVNMNPPMKITVPALSKHCETKCLQNFEEHVTLSITFRQTLSDNPVMF